MRSVLICVLLAAACSPASTDYPVGIGPGGIGGGGSGGGPDAGSGSGSGSGSDSISARVCLLTDVRNFSSCASTGADGITVSLPGVASVTTLADGSFVIQKSSGSDLVWSLTGTAIMPSTIGFGAPTIPAITNDAFTTLAANNGVIVDPAQGSVLGEILDGGGPAVVATVTSNPTGEFPTAFYSSALDTDDWPGTVTDTFGTFWFAAMTPGTAVLTFTRDGGLPETAPTLPVTAGGVTFVTFGL